MGWEKVRGQRYFYEILSVDGEKVRKFWGNGIEAQMAAVRVAQEREARAKDLAVVRAWEKRDRVIDRKTDALDAFFALSLERVLMDAGYHRHKGQLRKRRKSINDDHWGAPTRTILGSLASPESLDKSNGTGSAIPLSRGISLRKGRKSLSDDSQGSTDGAEKSNGSVSPISLAREISLRKGQKTNKNMNEMNESNESKLSELKAECLQMQKSEVTGPESANEVEDEVRRLSLEALRGLKGVEHPTLVCDVDATIAEITRKVQVIKDDFRLERSNAFDRMMLDQLTTTWVQWYVANWLLDSENCLKRSYRQNQYLERRFSRAQVRLTKAIDQLARLRGIPRGHLENGRW